MSLLHGEGSEKSSACTYTMLSDGMPKMYTLLDVAWSDFTPYPVTITDISKELHDDYAYTQVKTYMEIGGVKIPFLFDITPKSAESEMYTMDIRFEGDDPIDVNEFVAIKFQTITLFDVPEDQLIAKMKEAYQGIQGDLDSLNKRIMDLLDSDDSIACDHESVDVAGRFEYATVPNSPRSFE